MACHLFSAKPLSKAIFVYWQLDPYEQISVKFQSKCKKNSVRASENIVCEIAAIVSKGKWIKSNSAGKEIVTYAIYPCIPASI